MDAEAALQAGAFARIRRVMLALTLSGSVGLWLLRDASWAASFLLGAILSFLNLGFHRRMVARLTLEAAPAPSIISLALRVFLLGAILFVILRFLSVTWVAVCVGLLVAGAAVLAEAIYQLIYARA